MKLPGLAAVLEGVLVATYARAGRAEAAGPPLQHGQVVRQAELAALLAFAGLGLLLLGAGALARRGLPRVT